MLKNLLFLFICFIGQLFLIACQDEPPIVKAVYHYQTPRYDSLALTTHTDTIHLPLPQDVFTDIRSFNLFYQNNIPHITFYDERSQTINFYNLRNQHRYHRLRLKKLFKKQSLYKTSVYVQNFDSIFIANNETIYLYDTAGQQKNEFALPEAASSITRAVLNNHQPLITRGSKAFALVRTKPNQRSLDAMREWKVLYELNLEKNKATLKYHLPALYHTDYYGDHFLDNNYCFNNRGHFVFSFPADTSLYETDLQGYHKAYFARSQFQQEAIQPVPKEALDSNDARKEYSLQYSYGTVLFDPYRKYYLRFVKHKVTEEAYLAKTRRKESILIFNENLSIIGECDWITGVDFESLFFTRDGKLYGRTNFRDENALHFVQLTYQAKNAPPDQLTQR